MRHGVRPLTLVTLPLATALLAGVTSASAQGAVRPLGPFDARRAETVREGAMRRLRAPECRALLDEFRDTEGRPLSQRLAAFDVTADRYLGMLPFLDGSRRARCIEGQAELVTLVGVPRIFVCKAFLRTVNREKRAPELYVIHEMLHTLGLGEDPPTSGEISARVRSRCGR